MSNNFQYNYHNPESEISQCYPNEWNSTNERKIFQKYHKSSIKGDSILGLYGPEYDRFVLNNTETGSDISHQSRCLLSDPYKVSPLYTFPILPRIHPTYATVYRGQEHYYRNPY
jgi:hypothetical protein